MRLVCLSTPFLLYRPRSIPALVDVLITVVGSVAAVIALLLVLTLPIVIGMVPVVGAIVAFRGAWLPGLIGLGVGSAVAVLVFRRIADVLIGFRIRPFTMSGAKPPLPDPAKLLILQSAGDEAAAALAVPRLVNRLASIVFVRPLEALATYVQRALAAWERWPHALFQDPSELPWWLTTSILAILASGLLGLVLGFAGLERIGVLLLVTCGSLVICAVGVLVSLLALPLMVLYLLAFLPFGYDTALVSLFFEVDANTTPPGTWTVRLIPSPPRFLAHGATYDSRVTVSAITEWISSRLGEDAFDTAYRRMEPTRHGRV